MREGSAELTTDRSLVVVRPGGKSTQQRTRFAAKQ